MDKRNDLMGKYCTWIVVFTSFYYPIGAGLVLLLQVPSTPVNILLRSLPTLASIYLIALFWLKRKVTLKLPIDIWFLLLFWIIYASRILYDLSRGIKFADYENSVIYGITFGNILIPLIAIILWYKYVNVKLLNKLLYIMFIISNLIIFSVLITQKSTSFILLFASRGDIHNANNDISILNPITIGFHGSLLSLVSLYLLMYCSPSKWLLLFFSTFLLGFAVLMLGASRGPFFGFFISVFILLFHRLFHHKHKFLLILKYFAILSVAGMLIYQTIGKAFSSEDFAMLNRVVQFSEDRKTNEVEYRDIQYASAWNDFLDSPILGKQFVGTMDNFYPHNFILELLMATGLIGAFFFMAFFVPFLIKLKRIFFEPPNSYVLVCIVYIPVLIGNLFSGSLFQSVDFWLLMAFITLSARNTKSPVSSYVAINNRSQHCQITI